MITDFKEIENSALNLDRKNKARLADKLLQSIHGKIDPEIEQAWIDEVQKRKIVTATNFVLKNIPKHIFL